MTTETTLRAEHKRWAEWFLGETVHAKPEPAEDTSWRAWKAALQSQSAELEALRAAQVQAKPEPEVASDQVIALAEALQVRRILEEIKAVMKLYPADDMPTPFQSAWAQCCEEIFYRATGEQWHMDEDDPQSRAMLRLKAANDERAALQAREGEWIPVSERMPEPETDVLCWRAFGAAGLPPIVAGMFAKGYAKLGWFAFDDDERELQGVTHWMPLPEPPGAARTPDSSPAASALGESPSGTGLSPSGSSR